MQITWNTDVNAPCCPGEIVADDGRTILAQTDWDFPGIAGSFGWSIREVQNPQAERAIRCIDLDEVEDFAEYLDACRQAWLDACPCDHDGTDGTVDCPDCGLTASDFIVAAGEWLADNDGATADDPGYFEGGE